MVSFLHSFVWQHNSVRNILSFCRYFNRCHWSLSMLNVPLHCYWLKVGFPRDGTICELLSFWYETKIFSCLVVPLSRNKGRSKKKDCFENLYFFFGFFFTSVPCLVPWRDWTRQDMLAISRWQYPIQAHPSPSRGKMSKSRPGPSHGKILNLSCCPFDLRRPREFCPFVLRHKKIPSRWKR